jgi:hypothetical protein
VEKFLKEFSLDEGVKLYQWWTSLVKKKADTAWIFKAALAKRYQRKNRFTVFEVININEENQLISLRRYNLNFLRPNPKSRDLKSSIITVNQAVNLVKKTSKKAGALFFLAIHYPKSELNDQFKAFYLAQFKEKIIPYLNQHLHMLDTIDHIFLLASQGSDMQSHIQIAQTILRIVTQYVEVNSIQALVKFNLSVIEHKYFPQDLYMMIKKARELNQFMYKQKVSLNVYDPSQPMAKVIQATEEQYFVDIYQKFAFDVKARPLVLVPEAQQLGSQLAIKPQRNMPYTTFDILTQASQLDNPKEFFRRYFFLVNNVIKTNANVTFNYIPMSLSMKDFPFAAEPLFQESHGQYIYGIDEQELKTKTLLLTSLEPFLNVMRSLQGKLALNLDDYTINLEETMYQAFDYFVLDQRLISQVQNDERGLLTLKLIFQNFAKFHKPFIVVDIPLESVIDLLPANHVKILGGDFISPYQTSVPTLAKRTLNRLKNHYQ